MAGRHRAPRKSLCLRIVSALRLRPDEQTGPMEGEPKSADELLRLLEA